MQVWFAAEVPADHPIQSVFDDPSTPNDITDHTRDVVRGARVVNTKLPVTAPKALPSVTIENVVELITVAVNVPLTAAQFPVPPLIVTDGKFFVET